MGDRAQNLRRIRTYGRRVAGMAKGRLPRNCFFMHVPKCGGSSIAEALYAIVPMQQRVGVIDANASRRATAMIHAGRDEMALYFDDFENGDKVYDLRNDMLLYHMAWDSAVIHGHILFSEFAWQHFHDRYAFVSILRDPVSRVLSNYAHSASGNLVPTDFDEYLESAIVRTHGLSFLRFFAGQHWIEPQDEAAVLERAKTNLDRFDVIGFLDDLPDFCDQIHETLGRKPKIFRYNEKKWPSPQPTQGQMDRLRDIMANEIAFWDYAQHRRRRVVKS